MHVGLMTDLGLLVIQQSLLLNSVIHRVQGLRISYFFFGLRQ